MLETQVSQVAIIRSLWQMQYSNMVSDQVVSHLSVPTKAGASFAAPVHRGVIETPPLRGNEAIEGVHDVGNQAFLLAQMALAKK